MAVVKEKELLSYPKSIKPLLEKATDIEFSNGRRVPPSEVWRFMTEEAPVRFPFAFDSSRSAYGRMSEDFEFVSGIKYYYLLLTLRERLIEYQAKGSPLILIQGGQTMEPYFAAGGIALRPWFVMLMATYINEGLNLLQCDFQDNKILEQGRRKISIDACNQIAAHAAISEGVVDIDLIAPYLCLRCSDMAYLTETHRSNEGHPPLQLIDYPIGGSKESSVTYLSKALRRLTAQVSKISGKELTDERLRQEIKTHNRFRRLVREIVHLWWSAKTPPINSTDLKNIIGLGNEPYGDPTAVVSVLEEAKAEIQARISNGVKGVGLHDNPARLYVCGSCVTANPFLVDKAGGVVVGQDDEWSEALTHVEEEGDPYENLAQAILSFPYEQSSVERALWTVEQVKKSKADGFLFIYNWGCNFQSAVARLVADVVKEKAGIPSIYIGVGDLGRAETTEQSQNRIEAFIEMLRLRKHDGEAH